MATIWKGAINFGLINVPIKLTSATAKESVAFRSLHKKCKTPINQKRWCSHCDEEVAYEDLVKGFEYEKGSFVALTKSDLEKIPLKSTKYIQIEDFISIDEVDPIYFEKSYFLVPEAAGEKPYLLLYKAMQKARSVAVAKITLREKEHLCLVRVFEDSLMLNTMFFFEEIRTPEVSMEKIEQKNSVSAAETDMAIQLIGNLTKKFEPQKYKDSYRSELLKIVNSKVEGEEIVRPDFPKMNEGKAFDLFERLKASLEATSNQEEKKPKAKSKKPPSKPESGDYAH